jgi:hypothetical protein
LSVITRLEVSPIVLNQTAARVQRRRWDGGWKVAHRYADTVTE